MNIGKYKNKFAPVLVFLLFALPRPLTAQERTVFIRVICTGDNVQGVCTDKARDEAEKVVVEEMHTRLGHFLYQKASLDLKKDLCGTMEITVSRFQRPSTWRAAIVIYKGFRTCIGKPQIDKTTPLPMLDVKDRISPFPTYLQFAQGVRDAMNQYLTLNGTLIETALWNAIPLGFGAQLKNQDGKFEAAVVVKYYKQLDEAPRLFATALFSMKDLNAAHGALFFLLEGFGCIAQQDQAVARPADELQIKATPIQVIGAAADARKYVQDDSAIFQTMTDNVIYMSQPGEVGECGAVLPSGFAQPAAPPKTTASTR